MRAASRLIILLMLILLGNWTHGSSFVFTNYFQNLKIGGGGFVVGQEETSKDGTQANTNRCVRTDTYGAYCWSWSQGKWCQLITKNSMPINNFGFYPSPASFTGTIAGTTLTVNTFAYGGIGIGQTLVGAGISGSPTITALGTGRGGIGTYTISGSQTVSSPEAMTTTGALAVLQQTGGAGVVEIATSKSSPNVGYMVFNGLVFVSTNISNPTCTADGTVSVTWTQTALTQMLDSESGDTYRINGRKMAVDPANPNVVYVGSPVAGLFVTYNGGTSWSSVSGVPSATADGGGGSYPGYNIAFDPNSGTTTCPDSSSPCTNTIYAYPYQLSGSALYVSTNGGLTWSATTGGPANGLQHMIVDQNSNVWAVDGVTTSGANLWKYASGTWTEAPGSPGTGWHTVTVDPANASTLVLVGGAGGPKVSLNGGTSWSGTYSFTLAATDAPWQAAINQLFLSTGDTQFDPTQSHVLICDCGQGVWSSVLPSGSFTWTSMVAGIEQLVGNQIIVPKANQPLVAADDEIGLSLVSTSTNYAAANQINPVAIGEPITGGYGIDYASSNPNFFAAIVTAESSTNTPYSFSGSATGAIANFLPWNSWNATILTSGSCMANNGSGLVRFTLTLACGVPGGTSGLTTWANGSGSIVTVYCTAPTAIGVTLNVGGTSNFPVTVGANYIDLQNSAFVSNYVTYCPSYVVYVATGPFTTWGGEYSISNITSSGGAINVAWTTATGAPIGPGTIVIISGVTGTTEANGNWVVKSKSGQSAVLYGSTFVNNYISGGSIYTWAPPGGYIAASTPSNVVSVGMADYPYCTTDGGQTWSVPSGLASTGWINAYFDLRHTIAADRVTANTFYGYNHASGFYSWTNCATATLVSAWNNTTGTPVGNPGTNSNVDGSLKTVPGEAGHFFYLAGAQSGNHPQNTLLWRSCNGGANFVSGSVTGATWANVSGGQITFTFSVNHGISVGDYIITTGFLPSGYNGSFVAQSGTSGTSLVVAKTGDPGSESQLGTVSDTLQPVKGFFEPRAIGFGHAANGKNYSAIIVGGWYSSDNNSSDARYGIWRSTDDANNGVTGACVGGNTWALINDYPVSRMDFLQDVAGDMNVYGAYYGAFSGSGYFWGQFNYLLHRDLDPASNDNSPVGLDKAA